MAVENNINNLDTPIIDFSLRGVDEKFYSLSDFSVKEILVIIFMCNHCPYVKAVMKRLVNLQDKLRSKSVQFIGINPNDTVTYPEDSFKNMILFHREYNMNFPYLEDATQLTASKYDAVCTPDIYVYNKERILKYRGRLDDNWKDESIVTKHDLEIAIEEILNGKEPVKEQIPSMGCSIKWKM